MLHQHGLKNTVATSGTTSFKASSMRTLARYVQSVYIVFDPDEAGRTAEIKAIEFLKEVGITDIKSILLPEGEDAASFIIKYGKDKFLEVLKNVGSK